MHRRPNTQTVQWFLELHASGQLNLNPSYQRRSVWSDDYRRFFIDTILKDFPCPAIYLENETRAGAPTRHNVIDGKQRLEAIIEFTMDKFHLGSYLDDEDLADAYYSDLPESKQQKFVDYVLSVENISRSNPHEIREAFARLNRNTAKLNRQELRKAQFDGAFITKMTNLARHPFWSKINVATRARISRMQDVEYVSEIFILTMDGIQEGSANALDEYYAQYDEQIPDEDQALDRFEEILLWMNNLPLEWRNTRWRNLGDFYSLWAARIALGESIPADDSTAEKLRLLSERLEEPRSPAEISYSNAVRQGTSKEANRRIRAEVLAEVLINDPE
ncbi:MULTISPECIES: DUF262 domain-containing protein [Tsukamurella]|nr:MULTISPECIES: DUF262 domain-containing protein [Tsukamurella]